MPKGSQRGCTTFKTGRHRSWMAIVDLVQPDFWCRELRLSIAITERRKVAAAGAQTHVDSRVMRSRLSPYQINSKTQPGSIRQTKAVRLSTGVPHSNFGRPAPGEGDDGVDICQNRGFPLHENSATEPVDGKQRLAPGKEARFCRLGVVSIGGLGLGEHSA
jgi:hypothetical protein